VIATIIVVKVACDELLALRFNVEDFYTAAGFCIR